MVYHKKPISRREEYENAAYIDARNAAYDKYYTAQLKNDRTITLKALALEYKIPYSSLATGYPKYSKYKEDRSLTTNNDDIVEMNIDGPETPYTTNKGGRDSLFSAK